MWDCRESYFFMIIYLKALPSVWSSASNSNDAAVSLAPGSYMESLVGCIQRKVRFVSDHSYPLIIEVCQCFIMVGRNLFSACSSSIGHGLIFRSED